MAGDDEPPELGEGPPLAAIVADGPGLEADEAGAEGEPEVVAGDAVGLGGGVPSDGSTRVPHAASRSEPILPV